MITKDDLQYESEYLENASVPMIENSHKDCVLIWITGSSTGNFKAVLQYASNKKFISGFKEGATANQAYIHGITAAVNLINKPCRICVVTPASLGFDKAFRNKGVNVALVLGLYSLVLEKGCSFTETVWINGAESIKRFINACSGIPEYMNEVDKKKEIKQGYKDAYRQKLYDECLQKVLKILKDNNVDSSVIKEVLEIKASL